MNTLNALLTRLTDALFAPLVGWPAWLPLVLVSAVAGVVMAVVFRFTSRQELLRRDAELVQAQLLAMKLFKDNSRTMFVSLGRLLRHTGRRLWHSLPPVLVMTVPFVLLLVQLARWYEHAPLVAGDQAVVELHLADDAWQKFRDVPLESSSSVAVQTPSLRDPVEKTLYWRIRVDKPAVARVQWQLGEHAVVKSLTAAVGRGQLAAVDTRRPGSGWWDRLLYPGEAPLAEDSPAQAVVVHYPQRSTPIFGIDLPWWATFLIVSIVAAILARPVVKVQF
jgi:hypothetical protein